MLFDAIGIVTHNYRMEQIECKDWCVYLLLCEDGSYYAGVTNDLAARFAAHVAGKGARYTRAHKPIRVLAFKSFGDRSLAQKAEWAVKQLPKSKKINFFHQAT